MGCICSKGTSVNEDGENLRVKGKEPRRSSKRLVGSSRREEVAVEVDGSANDVTTRLISTAEVTDENAGSTVTAWDEEDEEEEKTIVSEKHIIQKHDSNDVGKPQISRSFSVRNGIDGAQVAAGWPSWLTAVAGEAIKGWVPRKAESFEKLDKIGQGTYSSVYKARDKETGKIVALKKVRFVNMDPESVRFMAREILILRRLDHPNVMKLEGLVTSRVSGNLYLVFEYMEHDLAGLAASPKIKFTEPQIKCYMQQLLRGLEHCHSRGVLHRDIKGSNLLIGNNGNLKIGDFGLATFFHSNQKQTLTSRVVTLWYRPPELLLGATDYGVGVDMWSVGCILAELYAGKPIMPGRTEVEQLHKIFKLCGSPSEEYWKKSKLPHATIFKPQHSYKRCVAETLKGLPSSALSLLDTLLAIEPEVRGTTSSALQSEFFTKKPLPCEPSSLPKYPPSKEFDVKIREEEARRQKAAAGKGHQNESHGKGTRESKAVPAPDANAELQSSIQKRQGHSNPKSNSEKFNPEEDGGSGFPLGPSKGLLQNGVVHGRSGQPVNMNGNGAELMGWRAYNKSVIHGGSSRFDHLGRETNNAHMQWPEEHSNGSYNPLTDGESSHSLLDRAKSTYKQNGHSPGKESLMGHGSKKNRFNYSGPLIPDGNMDEMLKEHEKRIQHAVRKARLDKSKTKKNYGDNGQTESLLGRGVNVR
ncbi:hypothetical protein LguiA_008494 [Lonicera macranthoides]